MSSMTPPIQHRFHPRSLLRSAGIGLVTAVFLLVVLAAIGVAAVRIFGAQQAGSSLDVDGARAYQAARAGIEWGLFQRLRNDACATTPLESSFALPGDSVLRGFTVTVTCTPLPGPLPADGNAATTMSWRIRSVACNQPVGGMCRENADGAANPNNHPDYVQRRLEVQV